jgi:dipeptidase D
LEQEIKEQYDEPDVKIYGDDVDAFGSNAIPTEQTAKIIALLCAAPNGVQKMSQDIEGLVQTSLNLGIVNSGEEVKFVFSVRSSVNDEKVALLARLRELAEFNDATYSQMGDYPAWEYREESPLRDLSVETYEKLFGVKPQVVAIHAGLECGLLGEKLPGLDCISFGPQMHDIHTSREKLEIESVKRTWEFLLETLKNL